jgi:thermitase
VNISLWEDIAAARGVHMFRWLIIALVLALALVLSAGQGQVSAQASSPPGDSADDADNDGDVDGEILVKFKSGTSKAAKDETHRQQGGRVKENLRKSGSQVAPDIQVVEVSSGDEETKSEEYTRDKKVEYAEPNFIYQPLVTTDDTDFAKLYGLDNTGQTVNNVAGTADADIDAPEAWDATTGLADTVVAVIDTGVDISHPDLKYNIWKNPGESGTDSSGNDKATNGVDDDGNTFVDDVNGWDFFRNENTVYDAADGDTHGTHVAGTIAAEGNNGAGVVGVNWKAQVMPLKFLGPNGGSTSNAIKAIDYAVSKRVTISNNSWGGSGYSQALKDALSNADNNGHLFVAAAGNGGADKVGDNNDSYPSYPASYDNPNVVSVAATDSKDALASFSNYGATSVDLAAPGVYTYSTLPGNTYGYKSGTSMATPHVTGVAALIKSKDSTLDDVGVKTKLLDFVDKKGNLSGKTVTGGRLNAAGALSTTTITAGPSGTVSSTTARFEFSSSESGATFQCSLDNSAFEPCTSPKEYTSLSGGSHTFRVQAVDAAGKVIDPTPANRTWTVDTSAPTVSSVKPANGATGRGVSSNVTATFSEAMNSSTVNTTTFMLAKETNPTAPTTPTPATAIASGTTVTLSAAGLTATLNPYGSTSTNLARCTWYTAVVKGGSGGAADRAGNTLDEPGTAVDRVWSFKTSCG